MSRLLISLANADSSSYILRPIDGRRHSRSGVAGGDPGGRRRWPRAGQRGAMIIGIGTDLIDIRRVERTLQRFGDRFLERVFTAAERARAETPDRPPRRLCQALCGQGSLRQGARHRLPPRRVLARHRGAQSAERPADPGPERRRRTAAGHLDARGHECAHRCQPDRRTAARPGGRDHQRAPAPRRDRVTSWRRFPLPATAQQLPFRR